MASSSQSNGSGPAAAGQAVLPPPLQAALHHLGGMRKEGQRHISGLQAHIGSGIAALQSNVGGVASGLRGAIGHAMEGLQQQSQQMSGPAAMQSVSPGFASLSLSSMGRPRHAPEPVAELSMHPGEVAARLRGVVVYTVVNSKDEFVLVSGEDSSKPRQLGLFFFSEADAKSLITKIQDQDPKLGRQAKIMPVGMDQVYRFAISPRQKGLEGASFRFMPEMQQVESAVELYKDAGLNVDSFVGVPVFQVEGLNVKTEKAKYTPLFLSKADLDSAVGNAFQEKEAKATQAASQRYQKAADEVEKAKGDLEAAEDDKSKRRAEARCSKAEAKAEKALNKLKELKKKSEPKVEVGSLEEVILNMESDTQNQWGDVMFIPPGSLAEIPAS